PLERPPVEIVVPESAAELLIKIILARVAGVEQVPPEIAPPGAFPQIQIEIRRRAARRPVLAVDALEAAADRHGPEEIGIRCAVRQTLVGIEIDGVGQRRDEAV